MQDLHIHTKYSDGEDDEYQIIERVKKAGITEFSICDHDTIEGSKKVYELMLKDKKIKYQTGVELSCRLKEMFNGVNIHLLVRDFDFYDIKIVELIEKVNELRKLKIERMVGLVEKVYGIRLSEDEVKEKEKTTNSLGKPHIYSLLQKYGDFSREQYYKNMRFLDSDDLKLDALEVIENLKNSKGYITLAHPKEIMKEYNLSYEDIDKIVGYLSSMGLDGLETRHSIHTEEDYKIFSRIAKKYDLLETCGSDYHGENVKPNIKVGVCVKE